MEWSCTQKRISMFSTAQPHLSIACGDRLQQRTIPTLWRDTQTSDVTHVWRTLDPSCLMTSTSCKESLEIRQSRSWYEAGLPIYFGIFGINQCSHNGVVEMSNLLDWFSVSGHFNKVINMFLISWLIINTPELASGQTPTNFYLI